MPTHPFISLPTNTLPQSIEGDSPQDITLLSSSSSSVDGNVFPEDPSSQDVEFEDADANNMFAALTRSLSCNVGVNTCGRGNRSHCVWVGGNRNINGACCEPNDWTCRNQFNGGGGTVLQNCNDFGIRTWNQCQSECRARHNNWSASYEGRSQNDITRCECDYGRNRRNNFTCERRANSPARRPTRRPTRRPRRNPTRKPTRRPSGGGGNNRNFDDGLSEGENQARRIWKNMGNSCANAWNGFEDAIQRRIRNRGWGVGNGNWRTEAYRRGIREGMDRVVTEKSAKCFRDNSSECTDLGEEAARILGERECQIMRSASRSARKARKQWRRDCRDLAIQICQGRVHNEVRDRCDLSLSTRQLRNLSDQCDRQVRQMIGDYFLEDYVEDSEDMSFEE